MYKQKRIFLIKDLQIILSLKTASLDSDGLMLAPATKPKDAIFEIFKTGEELDSYFEYAERILKAFHPYAYKVEINNIHDSFIYEK